MPCDEWCKLLERYRNAVKKYDAATRHLTQPPDPIFNATWQRAEQARKQTDNCRANLLQHEHDPGCLENGHPEHDNDLVCISADEFILGDLGQFGG